MLGHVINQALAFVSVPADTAMRSVMRVAVSRARHLHTDRRGVVGTTVVVTVGLASFGIHVTR